MPTSTNDTAHHAEGHTVPIDGIAAIDKSKAPVLQRLTYNPQDHQCLGPYLTDSSSSASADPSESGTQSSTDLNGLGSLTVSPASSRTVGRDLSDDSSTDSSTDSSQMAIRQPSENQPQRMLGWTEILLEDGIAEDKAEDDSKKTSVNKFNKYKKMFGICFLMLSSVFGAVLVVMAILVGCYPDKFQTANNNPNTRQ